MDYGMTGNASYLALGTCDLRRNWGDPAIAFFAKDCTEKRIGKDKAGFYEAPMVWRAFIVPDFAFYIDYTPDWFHQFIERLTWGPGPIASLCRERVQKY